MTGEWPVLLVVVLLGSVGILAAFGAGWSYYRLRDRVYARRGRAWDQRPPAPPADTADQVRDRAYVQAWLAYRWDQYRHGETGLRDVWLWASWWSSKVGIRPVVYGLAGGAAGIAIGYGVWTLLP